MRMIIINYGVGKDVAAAEITARSRGRFPNRPRAVPLSE